MPSWSKVAVWIVLSAWAFGAAGCGTTSDSDLLGDADSEEQASAAEQPVVDGEMVRDCGGLCLASDGFYCDPATNSCASIKCNFCIKSADGDAENAEADVEAGLNKEQIYCGKINKCLHVKNDLIGLEGDFCAAPCDPDAKDAKGQPVEPCPGGFACLPGDMNGDGSPDGNFCQPTVVCGKTTTQTGGVCEFGDIFKGYVCPAGNSCVGNPSGSVACKTDKDCREAPGLNDNYGCGEGSHVCGFSLCVTPCLFDGSCPLIEGLPLYPDTISGSCYCGPPPFFTKPPEESEAETSDGDAEKESDAAESEEDLAGDIEPADVEADNADAVEETDIESGETDTADVETAEAEADVDTAETDTAEADVIEGEADNDPIGFDTAEDDTEEEADPAEADEAEDDTDA